MPPSLPKVLLFNCHNPSDRCLKETAVWIMNRRNISVNSTVECLHRNSAINIITLLFGIHDDVFDENEIFKQIVLAINSLCLPRDLSNIDPIVRPIDLAICDIGRRGNYDLHLVTNVGPDISKEYHECLKNLGCFHIWTDNVLRFLYGQRHKWWNPRKMNIANMSRMNRSLLG